MAYNKGAQTMRVVTIKDWRLPDASELKPEEAKGVLVTGFREGNGLVFEFEAMGGKPMNQVVFELDKGYLRVRAYSAPGVVEKPLGELWVGREMAHYEKPYAGGQGEGA